MKRWVAVVDSKCSQECNTFVSVLIDRYPLLVRTLPITVASELVTTLYERGAMQFKDELIREGESGGQEACRLLVSSINGYTRCSSLDLRSGLGVIIRVYAHLRGLARTYKDVKILSDGANLDQFVRGFNKGSPLGRNCVSWSRKGMLR